MRQLAISFALCLPSLAFSAEAAVGEVRTFLQGKVALEVLGIERGRKLPVDARLDEIEVTLLAVADAQACTRVGEAKVTGWPEQRSTEECLS